jgi:hypothetical protein
MTEPKFTKSSCMVVTNEVVHRIDNKDIRDIEAINRDFIVAKRGFVNTHYYYIPVSMVKKCRDGHVVWLKITEEEAKRGYQKEIVLDQATYYIKDYPYEKVRPYPRATFPEIPAIEKR